MKVLIPDPGSPQSYDIVRALDFYAGKIFALVPEHPWYSPFYCPTALSLRVNRYHRLTLPAKINALSLVFHTKEIAPLALTYVEKIITICRQEQITLIYPSSDEYVLLFALFIKLFEKEKIEVPVNDFALLCRLMDKLTVTQLAGQSGLLVPLTLPAAEESWDVFPALLKPRFGCAGVGHRLVLNREELNEWRHDKLDPAHFVVQEFIPGSRIVYVRMYMDTRGNLQAASCAENCRPFMKLHQTRALLLRALPIPEEIVRRAKAMLKNLGYAGYCHFQMKTDERDRQDKVMEVNVRISRGTWSELSADFNPVQQARLLIKKDYYAKLKSCRGDEVGKLYIWPLQDVLILLFLLLTWAQRILRKIVGMRVPENNIPGLRSMWQHYRRTYFCRAPKRMDNYTRHAWHDPFAALACGVVFMVNYLIKEKVE